MELEESKKPVIIPIINKSHFDNFLACAQVVDKDLYATQFEFFIKVADFVVIFLKFQ